MLRSIRGAVLKAIEGLREQGIIKHSLEAQVLLHIDPKADWHSAFQALQVDLKKTPQGVHGFFEEFFIVSAVELHAKQGDLVTSEYPGLFVAVHKAPGQKCPRCWQWKKEVHGDGLCDRCKSIVG